MNLIPLAEQWAHIVVQASHLCHHLRLKHLSIDILISGNFAARIVNKVWAFVLLASTFSTKRMSVQSLPGRGSTNCMKLVNCSSTVVLMASHRRPKKSSSVHFLKQLFENDLPKCEKEFSYTSSWSVTEIFHLSCTNFLLKLQEGCRYAYWNIFWQFSKQTF